MPAQLNSFAHLRAQWILHGRGGGGGQFSELLSGTNQEWFLLALQERLVRSSNVSKGFCAWRQTGGCTPSGPREPEKDLDCHSHVDVRVSASFKILAEARV
jgi:hypothetical protein